MNVYQDQEADARQDDGTPAPSLFRKRYKQLTADEVVLHDAIKDKADELARLIVQVIPPANTRTGDFLGDLASNQGANATLALRHLEDAVYRAVKALTT